MQLSFVVAPFNESSIGSERQHTLSQPTPPFRVSRAGKSNRTEVKRSSPAPFQAISIGYKHTSGSGVGTPRHLQGQNAVRKTFRTRISGMKGVWTMGEAILDPSSFTPHKCGKGVIGIMPSHQGLSFHHKPFLSRTIDSESVILPESLAVLLPLLVPGAAAMCGERLFGVGKL